MWQFLCTDMVCFRGPGCIWLIVSYDYNILILPYGSKYSRDNIFMNFVSTLQITKFLHSKISVCITYKQALLKNLPSNESKVLIHRGSALYSAKIMRYTPKRLQTHATIGKYTLLDRTISNAMIVDT